MDEELTYRVFMGQLALERDLRPVAVAQYARAAQLSSDPSLLQHAATLAYEAGDDQLALTLVRRWRTLAPQDPDARHFEALLEARLGDVAASVAAFESLLRDVPSESFALISRLLSQETDAQHGLPVMRGLLAAYPQSAQAHFAFAGLALHYQHPQLAADEANRALAIQPHWDEALVLLGQALAAQGRSAQAVRVLQARLAETPDNTNLRLAFAALLAQAGEGAAAEAQFSEVLKRHPADAEALYTLGLLKLQDKQLAAAREYFLSLRKTGQRNSDAWYFLGNIAELQKNYAQALRNYQQVDDGEHWFAARIATARVLAEQGRQAEAREYMDSVIADDPGDAARLRLAESQVFATMGDDATALEVLNDALRVGSPDADLLYARALLEESMDQVTAAERDLRYILKRSPENAAALNALGYTLTVHSNRYSEALGYIQKALQLAPDDPAVIDSMGWVEFRLGNYPAALAYLRKAYARLADPQVAAHLAQALWVSGNRQEAHAVWSAALKQHPGDPDLMKIGRQFAP
ncbi:MAG: tetratricopeptide repeat protein [Gammaproteobacteria bacterium]|nr:tetratricopeptide repeat protein [Gammaproteobacteria bacterium]